MARATIIITTDAPEEVEAGKAWFKRWDSALSQKSENRGCGCCVDIYDVEGPQEAIDSIPDALKSSSAWVDDQRPPNLRGEVPKHKSSGKPWWKIW